MKNIKEPQKQQRVIELFLRYCERCNEYTKDEAGLIWICPTCGGRLREKDLRD